MKLEFWPQKALCDERINIRISDIPPAGKVKISAKMNFPWAVNVPYESEACFTADSNGNLDLSKQKPDSGSYDFIDSMGLIVSLKRVRGNFRDVMRNISTDQSLFIEITADCEQEHLSVKLERFFISAGIESLKINDKFVGELFYNDKPDNKTIIYLGGSSNEDLRTILPPTALLASHGFNVLALAYFGSKGLNSSLAEIPLEYF
jgi:hypothetical protein